MLANVGDLPYVIVIALVVLVGGSQLPKIARNVGLAGKEFRKAQTEAEEEQAAKAAAKNTANGPAPVPLPAAPAPVPPAAHAGPATAATAGTADEPGITLTPAQLDALLKAREEQVRNESGPASN
jgi:Sec-independent protein translocase protein TatA